MTAEKKTMVITPAGLNDEHEPIAADLRQLGVGVGERDHLNCLTLALPPHVEETDVAPILERHGYMVSPGSAPQDQQTSGA